jgi:glycosyltransferase involved in cell wall biosynthesis
MRVLLITNILPPHHMGGAEVMLQTTGSALMQRGVNASVLMVNARMPEEGERERELQGIPVHEITHRPYLFNNSFLETLDPRVLRDVMAEVRRVQPDLVHIHNVSGSSLAPFVACRRLDVPVVLTLHDLWLLCPNNMLYQRDGSFCDPALSPRSCGECFRRYDFWANIPYRRSVFAALTSKVRLFISPSQALVRLHEEAGYRSDRFRVVAHGLVAENDRVPDHPLIEELANSRGQFRTVAFAGGGIEIKGAKVLLEAVPLMLRHVDRLRIIVAGTGEEGILAGFRRYAPEVRVVGRVPFEEMGYLFSLSDIVLVPSTCAESFSLVTLESLQVGTPVVGSDLGGIPELIRDEETGYLFPTGDAVALAERVIHHFARPAYARRQMRHKCAEDTRTRFPLESHVEGTLQVYREALAI